MLRSMPSVFSSGFRTPGFGLQREPPWRSPFRSHRSEEEHWCYAEKPRQWHHQCYNNSHVFKYVNITVISSTACTRGVSCLMRINIHQQWCHTWRISLLTYAWFTCVIERCDGLMTYELSYFLNEKEILRSNVYAAYHLRYTFIYKIEYHKYSNMLIKSSWNYVCSLFYFSTSIGCKGKLLQRSRLLHFD